MKIKPVTTQIHRFPMSRLALSISALLLPLTTSLAAHAQNSFYANTPLHLQQTTTTVTPAGPKPNVMFLIDDSGSMANTAGVVYDCEVSEKNAPFGAFTVFR